jgi:membrane protease YdiL (CAAX protease family)
MRARFDALREVSSAFLAITIATVLLSWALRASPFAEYLHLIVAALFVWAAVGLSQRQPDGVARYGLSLGGLLEPAEPPPEGAAGALRDLIGALLRTLPSALRELGAALRVAAVIFPPFVAGFYAWHAPARAFALALPADPASFALTQWLVVGLPEEALFRGYMQSRLAESFASRTRLLGATLCVPALLIQAAYFALIHFAIDLSPARLAVFFPALLFGWVRAWRGGIGAAAALHAMCNLLSDVLFRGWL